MQTRMYRSPLEAVVAQETTLTGWHSQEPDQDCSLKVLRNNLHYYESHFVLGKVPTKKKRGKRSIVNEVEGSRLMDKENHTLPLVRSKSMSISDTASHNSRSVVVLNIDKPKTKVRRRNSISGDVQSANCLVQICRRQVTRPTHFYDITNKLPLQSDNSTRNERMFLRKQKNFNISHTLKLNKLRSRAASKMSELYLGDDTRGLKVPEEQQAPSTASEAYS